MRADGNCLFRAVSEAVYGDPEMHLQVRLLCVEHICKERAFFARYITEDFDSYIARKRQPGAHGNNVEITALSELYCRPVLVYCYDAEPLNTFQPKSFSAAEPIHLSYHSGNHFNALLDLDRPSVGVGLGLPAYDPGAEREREFKSAALASEVVDSEAQLFAASLALSEAAELEAETERAVQESLEAYELPAAAVELISAGFSEAEVVQGLAIFGDDLASLLCFLTGQ